MAMTLLLAFALLISLVSTGCYSLPDVPHPFVGNRESTEDDTGDPSSDSTPNHDTSSASGDTDTETVDSDANMNQPTCADGILCWDPPRECDGETHIKIFAEKGSCFEGTNGPECYYEYIKSEACESGLCHDGVCTGNPCQGVHCNHPDEPYCSDEQTLSSWNAMGGTCVEQNGMPQCMYVMNPIICDDGCIGGDDGTRARCQSHACYGISTYCTQIPADYCEVNGDGVATQWRFPMGVGIAEGGECICVYRREDYPETELDPMTAIPCDYGCDEEKGRCRASYL